MDDAVNAGSAENLGYPKRSDLNQNDTLFAGVQHQVF